MADPLLPVGKRFCRCGACGLYFNAPSPFDTHRVAGEDSGRRCLTVWEMKTRGMAKDAKGRWGVAPQEGREGLRASTVDSGAP